MERRDVGCHVPLSGRMTNLLSGSVSIPIDCCENTHTKINLLEWERAVVRWTRQEMGVLCECLGKAKQIACYSLLKQQESRP